MTTEIEVFGSAVNSLAKRYRYVVAHNSGFRAFTNRPSACAFARLTGNLLRDRFPPKNYRGPGGRWIRRDA